MRTTPVKTWRDKDSKTNLIGKTGEIIQWTIVRTPPKEFVKEAPYPVAIIQLDGGEKTIGQIVDWDLKDLKKGKKVIAVLRRSSSERQEGIIDYIIKFKLHED